MRSQPRHVDGAIEVESRRGEGATFSRKELDALTDLALDGIDRLCKLQDEALATVDS